jgi:hypothetical protein
VQPEPVKGAEARPEHAWLHRLLGDWRVESVDEGAGSTDSDWMETVRPIGDVWVVAEGRGSMPDGSEATMVITLGFDPRVGRYVGSWIGSMMTQLWVYDGELDADGTTLTLYADGPDFEDPGTTRRYRDVIALEGDDRRALRSALLAPDGTWKEFMTMRYRRAE